MKTFFLTQLGLYLQPTVCSRFLNWSVKLLFVLYKFVCVSWVTLECTVIANLSMYMTAESEAECMSLYWCGVSRVE